MTGFLSIALYYNHYQCLGHTARVLTLLSEIKKRLSSSDISVIHGSTLQKFLRFPAYINNYSISPTLFTYKSFRDNLKVDSSVVETRGKQLISLIERLDLSVFLSEYFPLGRNVCKYELLPVLYYLKRKHKKIFSSSGYPVISSRSFKDINKFIGFYDKVFVHTPSVELSYIADSYRDKKKKKEYLEFFRRHNNKVMFTGYILPSQIEFSKKVNVNIRRNKINILVTRGAGAYYPEIISSSIKTSDFFGKNFHFIIIAGPSTPPDEWVLFQKLFCKKKINNAVLVKYASNLNSLIRDSQLCISTASYNTSVVLMYFNKNSIVIPFSGYENKYYREQPSRARLLKDLIGSSIVEYSLLSPLRLKREIDKKINKFLIKRSKVDRHWFRGRSVFLEEFLSACSI